MRTKFTTVLSLLAILSLVGCLGPASATAWQGIQEARQQAGLPALAWDQDMEPYVQQRAEYLSANYIRRAHTGFDDFTAAYRAANADRPGPISEILAWNEWAPDAVLRGWQASREHWAIAMNPAYRRAAIAEYETDGLTTVVMWFTD